MIGQPRIGQAGAVDQAGARGCPRRARRVTRACNGVLAHPHAGTGGRAAREKEGVGGRQPTLPSSPGRKWPPGRRGVAGGVNDGSGGCDSGGGGGGGERPASDAPLLARWEAASWPMMRVAGGVSDSSGGGGSRWAGGVRLRGDDPSRLGSC